MTKELMDILEPVLGEELAKDIIAHRKGLKCPLTPRGATALVKQYQLTGNPVEAAEEHLNRGWQGFRAEWMQKGKSYRDERNPMPRETAFNRHQRECREVIQSKLNGDHGNDQYGSSGPAFDLEPRDYRAH